MSNDEAPQQDSAPAEDTAVSVPVVSERTDPGEPADDADSFDRGYVERLRKESAGYRDRASAAETALAAIQSTRLDELITATGVKPAAVRALVDPAELLTDGQPDAEKISAAAARARDVLGILPKGAPSIKGMSSGLMPRVAPRAGFADAFKPQGRQA